MVERHDECDALGAARLLDAVEAALLEMTTRQPPAEVAAAQAIAAEVRARCAAAQEALHLFGEDEAWSSSLEVFGSQTRYRRAGDGGRMTLRVDGLIEGVPLADVLAVSF